MVVDAKLEQARMGAQGEGSGDEAEMDIEDVIAGVGDAGFKESRQLRTSVTYRSRKASAKTVKSTRFEPVSSENLKSVDVPGTQTIYLKTFGCSHNQSDSEYMAGQLSAYGYSITEDPDGADLWLINTCTVKNPSQSAMETVIRRGKDAKKPLVVAGCVPQGSSNLKELEGVSIVGVQQIDRVVEVVEETLKGHEVRLLRRQTLPSLDLPKVRRNRFIEIIPINVGCLGACTYCKTKHARGHLGSYTVEALVERARSVIASGVKEIWLSSEDTGAYGRDIGTTLPTLLRALLAELPEDRSVMLRVGMTNPPYILQHLEAIAEALRHPCMYSFLHVPVQSGSDNVLSAMKREYSVAEFKTVVDTLLKLVPNLHIATDIICGFPGETSEDFQKTVALVEEYKFPEVHISQFYPRPGTPAARMKRVPTGEVKNRSRQLTSVFETFNPYRGMEGQCERVWVTDVAADETHLVGHTKSYVQVLLPASEVMLGTNVLVKITSVGRWSVMAVPVEPLPGYQVKSSESKSEHIRDEGAQYSCCGDSGVRSCECEDERSTEHEGNPLSAPEAGMSDGTYAQLHSPSKDQSGEGGVGSANQNDQFSGSHRNRKVARSAKGRRIGINLSGSYMTVNDEYERRRERIYAKYRLGKASLRYDLVKQRWSWVDWALVGGMCLSVIGIVLGICGLLYPQVASS